MADISAPTDFNAPAPSADDTLNAAAQPIHALDAQQPQVSAPAQPINTAPVDMLDPSGELVGVPAHQVENAITQGYKAATPEDLHAYAQEQKYGGVGQQLATAAEGAVSAATFGTSTGLERALNISSGEDISGRRETNPGPHMVGEGIGLIAPAFISPEISAGSLLERAGAGVAGRLLPGAAEAGFLAKIGSGAAKGAVENALFQLGDENSKMLASDPHQHIQTAISDVGLAALLGGGISGVGSSVAPLWKATVGKNIDSFLSTLSNRMGGIEGIAPAMDEKLAAAGMDVSPELKAALSGNANAEHLAESLGKSPTKAAADFQKQLKDFNVKAADSMVNALGRTPEQVSKLADLSERDAGEEIKDSLIKSLKERLDPVTKGYEKVSEKFKATDLDPATKAELSEKIAQIGLDAGSQESAAAKLAQRVAKEIPGIKNLEQLRVYTSGLANETSGMAKQELWGVGRQLKTALRDMEDKVLTDKVATEAPELIATHAEAREGYKALRDTMDELNDRLHVGAHGGPKTFISALKDMDGEAIVRRLSPKGRADIISELSTNFPEVAEKIRDAELGKLLKKAAAASKDDAIINPAALTKGIEGLSPEMRKFLISDEGITKLNAIQDLLNSVPEKTSANSITKAVDTAISHSGGSAMAMIAGLASHNPFAAGAGYLVGHLGKSLVGNTADGIRLGMLKFLGTSAPVNAAGFKTMVDMVEASIRGARVMDKGVKNIFKTGKIVLPSSLIPSHKDINKLDKQLQAYQTDPQKMMGVAGDTGHYLPDHAQAMGETAARVANYVNSQRPNLQKQSPLDAQPVMSAEQKAKFNSTLTLAQQPLAILPKIANGTLTSKDVIDMNAMYPDLCKGIQQKLMEQIITAGGKDQAVPYRTKQALSVFMQQPLDSTMTPGGIMAAQPKPQGPQQQPGAPEETPKHSMNSLNKLPGQYMTAEQTRASRHQRD